MMVEVVEKAKTALNSHVTRLPPRVRPSVPGLSCRGRSFSRKS
jgi:hypothetical protein